MKKYILGIALLIGGSLSFTSCCNGDSCKADTEQHEHAKVYQCPMDCENGKTYDEPGKCPVCNMEIKEVNDHHEH